MEKYVLFMDKTGEVVKRDIVLFFHSPNLADEIYDLVEQYGKIVQVLENVFENLIMSFYKWNAMMEESKAQNDRTLLQEFGLL